MSDKAKGVVAFSSDFDLKTGAKCKYLAMDSTFEIVPNEYRQMLTIHGYVSTGVRLFLKLFIF